MAPYGNHYVWLVLAWFCFGCGNGQSANPFAGYESEIYAGTTHWMCHPSLAQGDDFCAVDLDATVVNADGTTSAEPHTRAADPSFDCFYVYPTVSFDDGGNSDLVPGDDERFAVLNQFARFSRVCRTFAPVYRQGTVPAIINPVVSPDDALAQGDVTDSFRHYIANENDERGFVLVGHSQGAFRLLRLIAELIEGEPYLEERLIAAYLLGGTVEVPAGEDIGGSLVSTPLCRTNTQTGCVVTYASFRDTEPPSEETFFGITADPDTVAGCTNPGSLGGGAANLKPYFPTQPFGGLSSLTDPGPGPFADSKRADEITTPFYIMPDFVQAECVSSEGFDYLEITVLADEDDPRADDISGDLLALQGWGLHIVDATLAMGDLVALAESQAAAWSATR